MFAKSAVLTGQFFSKREALARSLVSRTQKRSLLHGQAKADGGRKGRSSG